jgi:hypothetical protein
MSQQQYDEVVGRSLRVSVSLDAPLHQFIRRAASDRHLALSATIRCLLAELAETHNNHSSEVA